MASGDAFDGQTQSETAAPEATSDTFGVDEQSRLRALASYGIMDSERDARFEQLAQDIARDCRVPIATITFIDATRQWFKASVGLDVDETPRDISVCTHTILDPGNALVIPDITQDVRFATNPLVTGEFGLMAYAGVPIVTADGAVLGTVCAMDHEPHDYQPEDVAVLQRISQQVSELLETARTANDLAHDSPDMPALFTTASPRHALPAETVDDSTQVADVSFVLTRPLIEAIGEDLDVVRLVDAFVEAVLDQFGWWAATVYWMQADRLTASPWWVAPHAPTGLANLHEDRPAPVVVDNLQIEFHDPILLDIGMARWLSDRDVLKSLGARNLVAIDIAGAAALAARIVFLVPSSRALSPTATRTLTTAAAVLPRVILQQRARQELTYRATHDALTGLYNRQGVDHVFSNGRVVGQFARAVLYLDIDNFKLINDTHGHRVGDEILVWVARMLTSLLRPTDTVFRIGGDEFLIVLDGIMDDDDVENVAHRLLQRMVRPVTVRQNVTVLLSVSLGGVRWEHGPLAEAIAQADQLMYSAKELGGGRAACAYSDGPVVFSSDIDTTTELDVALNDAIKAIAVALVHCDDNRPLGVQFTLGALLRHPDLTELLDVAQGVCEPYLLAASAVGEQPVVQAHFDAELWELDGMIIRLAVGLRERFANATVALVCDPQQAGRFTDIIAAVRRGVGLDIVLSRFGSGHNELSLLDTVAPDILELDATVIASLAAGSNARPGTLVAADALARANNLRLQAAIPTAGGLPDHIRQALRTIGVTTLAHPGLQSPESM